MKAQTIALAGMAVVAAVVALTVLSAARWPAAGRDANALGVPVATSTPCPNGACPTDTPLPVPTPCPDGICPPTPGPPPATQTPCPNGNCPTSTPIPSTATSTATPSPTSCPGLCPTATPTSTPCPIAVDCPPTPGPPPPTPPGPTPCPEAFCPPTPTPCEACPTPTPCPAICIAFPGGPPDESSDTPTAEPSPTGSVVGIAETPPAQLPATGAGSAARVRGGPLSVLQSAALAGTALGAVALIAIVWMKGRRHRTS